MKYELSEKTAKQLQKRPYKNLAWSALLLLFVMFGVTKGRITEAPLSIWLLTGFFTSMIFYRDWKSVLTKRIDIPRIS